MRSLIPRVQFINDLGTDGNSDDEVEDREDGLVYHIRALPWRSMALTEYLRALDVVHLSTHWSPAGQGRQGEFPHIRNDIRGLINAEAKPVPGLPRCFYNEEYLMGLSDRELIQLNIQDTPVDLTIPPHVME